MSRPMPFAAGWASRAAPSTNWRSKYAGLEVNEAKRLRALESENAQPKKLLAEKLVEDEAMRDVLSKKW